MSVQVLKVFESEDVDASKLHITNMKGLKRTVRRLGNLLGHRKGIHGDELLPYRKARELIYLPIYLWVLDNCLRDELGQLREITNSKTVAEPTSDSYIDFLRVFRVIATLGT